MPQHVSNGHVAIRRWQLPDGSWESVRCVSRTPEQAAAEREELSLQSGWRPRRWWQLRRSEDQDMEFPG